MRRDQRRKGKEAAVVPAPGAAKGQLVAAGKPAIGADQLNQFFVQFDNSAYVVSDDAQQVAEQSIKLHLEADMQVTVNFIYHMERLQNDFLQTPLIFKDALVLMLHQLYALRRDSLAKLTYAAVKGITMAMMVPLVQVALPLGFAIAEGSQQKVAQLRQNWDQIREQYTQFADFIEEYFFAEDFTELTVGLRNFMSFDTFLNYVGANTNEQQKMMQEMMQSAKNEALGYYTSMNNRNNPITIRKRLAELKSKGEQFTQICKGFGKLLPVDELIKLTGQYLSAYEHYVTVMDNISQMITKAGQDENAFHHYIGDVNRAIMDNQYTYLTALIIEIKNQEIRLNAMSTPYSNMRKQLINGLELNMHLIYNYWCRIANQNDQTLSEFLRDNLTTTKQLSVMVLEAQNRILVTGYSQQPELKAPAHPQQQHGEEDVVEIVELGDDDGALPSHSGSSSSAQGQLVLVDHSNKQIQSRVKEHQEQLKQAQEQHAIHEQSVESAKNTIASAQTYQQAYAQIAAYWLNRGPVGGFFARARQTAQQQYGCIDESNPEDLKKHTEAKSIFDNQLKDTGSVAEIAALWEVAEPFINRHRNDFRDIFFSVNHTSSWRDKMEAARSKAYGLLKQEANAINDVHERKTYYLQWRNHPLFAEHRRDSVFTGAWGRTSTKAKIVDEIEKCDKAIAKASAKKR